jgi:hypothetical protein
MTKITGFTLLLLSLTTLGACHPQDTESAGITRTGFIQDPRIDEASGMQAARLNPGAYFLHNDEGKARVFAMDGKGANLGSFIIEGAKNRDWEDISWAPSESGPLLVLADSGDKQLKRKSLILYFILEPLVNENNLYSGSYPIFHRINLKYPDGAHDCESVAFDPASGRIYLLSKRDKIPGIYSISLQDALAASKADLSYDGDVTRLRPPTRRDMMNFGRRDGQWVSKPTGLDFNADGTMAAIITYRSLYLYRRNEDESWPTAFARKPVEFEGPPSRKEESVSFSPDGTFVMVTAEDLPAPVYRFRLLTDADE